MSAWLEILLEHIHLKKPSLPKEGIPRQWVPRWVRQSVKWMVLPFVLIDVSMQKVARWVIRPPFYRSGSCKRQGNCCYYILIAYSRSWIGSLYFFWYTQFLGFYPRYKEPQMYQGKLFYVMGCRYLKDNGSCSQYRLRPLICRKWPLIERFGYPHILKGCGFRVHEKGEEQLQHPVKDVLSEGNSSSISGHPLLPVIRS